MTVVMYLRETTVKYMLLPSVQSTYFQMSIFMFIVQFSMFVCLLISIVGNENGKYGNQFYSSFYLFYVKFPCQIVLHFLHYPEI